MTTDKNNSCHPGATAPGFKIAARLRGEKEDVVFTSCSGCFQKNLQASKCRSETNPDAIVGCMSNKKACMMPQSDTTRQLSGWEM